MRALTRDPASKKARSLAALGAEVVQADMDDRRSLERAFDGVTGVFNVQNHHISGHEGEVRQGRNVVDVAKRLAVPHVVYGAAGIGSKGTEVGSWETKVDVAAYMRGQDLPVTVLRPMAFMELMTESKFFPAAGADASLAVRTIRRHRRDDHVALVARQRDRPRRPTDARPASAALTVGKWLRRQKPSARAGPARPEEGTA